MLNDHLGPRRTSARNAFVESGPWVAVEIALMTRANDALLRVEIRDKETGDIVPAMVCITSDEDKKWRVPPNGAIIPPYSTSLTFHKGYPWRHGDIGPVRLTNGEYGDNTIRSRVYEGASAYPFWREAAAYFVSEPFSIKLTPGKWRLAVARGIESVPVFEDFTVSPQESARRTIFLQRWVNMSTEGWYSGDDHVHYPRSQPEDNDFLLTWAEAEDVHVVNVLRMGDARSTYFEQIGYGTEHRVQRRDYVLVSGQEDPRADICGQGHVIALNITEPVRNVRQYHLYDLVFDEVHSQGGATGYAHLAWSRDYYRRTQPGTEPTWDATINLVRGKVDFCEILQFRQLGLDDFYDFLNMGFRLSASAGSDVPWGNTIGEARVYAFVGKHFSADTWFAALKGGHTFVTNGPMLNLDIEAAIPGNELAVRRDADVRVRARAWAPEIIGSPMTLEVVASGDVIRSTTSRDVKRTELRVDFRYKVKRSEWIAARVRSHNGAVAHTSPIYLSVDDKGWRSLEKLQALVTKRLKILSFIDARLREPQLMATYDEGEMEALRGSIAEARACYQRVLEVG